MKTYLGIENLLAHKDELPESGWIFVDKNFNTISANDILTKKFILAENEDEEFDFEDEFRTWLEAPMFLAIMQSRLQSMPNATTNELITAAVHYLEYDTFI